MNENEIPGTAPDITSDAKAEIAQQWINQYSGQFKELMAYYRCAMMEVSTKFNVMNEELSLRYNRNPIESIKSRLKTPESISDKLRRKGKELTVESIERNLNDVAGIRVIVSFPSDIYRIADALLRQDDVILIEKKDYIENPKKNGYRSLHLIIAIPIFLHDHKKIMTVEVQFRTIGMDWWASLEHKIKYKRDIANVEQVQADLLLCAQSCFYLDTQMESIYNVANGTDDAGFTIRKYNEEK